MRYGRMQAACFIAFRRSVTSSFLVLTSLSYTSFYFAYPAPAFERRTARVVHSIGKPELYNSITLHGLLAFAQCKVVFEKIITLRQHSKSPSAASSHNQPFRLPHSITTLALVRSSQGAHAAICLYAFYFLRIVYPALNKIHIPVMLRIMKN